MMKLLLLAPSFVQQFRSCQHQPCVLCLLMVDCCGPCCPLAARWGGCPCRPLPASSSQFRSCQPQLCVLCLLRVDCCGPCCPLAARWGGCPADGLCVRWLLSDNTVGTSRKTVNKLLTIFQKVISLNYALAKRKTWNMLHNNINMLHALACNIFIWYIITRRIAVYTIKVYPTAARLLMIYTLGSAAITAGCFFIPEN